MKDRMKENNFTLWMQVRDSDESTWDDQKRLTSEGWSKTGKMMYD